MPKRKPDPYLIDDENPEWTEEDFKRARPVRAVMGDQWIKDLQKLGEKRHKELAAQGRKPLGRPPVEKPKVSLSLRLDADVVAAVRASGPGYNSRIEKLLRTALARGRL
jgi:uncharacterized protein (DUF4415 family)